MKEFTQKEVAELLKIKYQTIAFYANQKMVIPEIENPKGRGTTRKYSIKNLCQIYMIKQLSEYGYSHRIIKDILDYGVEI